MITMDVFAEYLAGIGDPLHRGRTGEVLEWVLKAFPGLQPKIAWNQPMFTDHGIFIIAFSIAKGHLAVAPERAGILRFSNEILRAGYEHSKELVRIKWSQPVDYPLLERMIQFNRQDKAGCSSFWRKS